MKRNHGRHNKTVCDKLYLQEDYICNDWIVTTSFYSAIHFLDHALFPVTHSSRKFDNINEAHNFMVSSSKHQTRGILLTKYLPKHAADYDFLIEESQNARYVDYDVNPAISNKAVRIIDSIIKSYDKEKKDIK